MTNRGLVNNDAPASYVEGVPETYLDGLINTLDIIRTYVNYFFLLNLFDSQKLVAWS
jgi:hypothetical protein